MAKTIIRTAKTVAKISAPRSKVVEKPIEVIVTPKAPSGWMDKVTDLVKWVDSPFKLFTIIIMGITGLLGYIAFEQQELIIENITSKDKMKTLLADEKLSSLSRDLLRDSGADIVLVHHINLPQNISTIRIAQSHDGRFTPLEGKKGAIFSDAPERNKAAISMLNGEILCQPFKVTSHGGDWAVSRGVTYTCSGSIPPDVGHMIGYIAIGFKKELRDISSVKSLINQTARAMTQ